MAWTGYMEEKQLWVVRFPHWNSQALAFLRTIPGFSVRGVADHLEVKFFATRGLARYVEDQIVHRCELVALSKRKGCEMSRPMRDWNEVRRTEELEHWEGRGWIQWNETDVCMDVTCACGEVDHVDGGSANYWRCPACMKVFAIGQTVRLYEMCPEFKTHCINDGEGREDE